MKAIETKYKGYRFRSRLEARWAVFFDALGLKWEYEPEGYDLGDQGWYLPDFYLPEFNCWIEIKGAKETDEELNKCRRLSYEMFGPSSDIDVMLTFDPYILLDMTKQINEKGFDGPEVVRHMINKRGKVYLFNGLMEKGWLAQHDKAIEVFAQNVFESLLFWGKKSQIGVKIKGKFHPRKIFPACVEAARSARFEHGESP